MSVGSFFSLLFRCLSSIITRQNRTPKNKQKKWVPGNHIVQIITGALFILEGISAQMGSGRVTYGSIFCTGGYQETYVVADNNSKLGNYLRNKIFQLGQ